MKLPCLLTSLFVLLWPVLLAAQPGIPDGSGRLESLLSKLPIYFVESCNGPSASRAYHVQGRDRGVFFTREGVSYQLNQGDRSWVVKLGFVGADPGVVPRGEDRQEAVFSYFRGPKDHWKTGLATFGRVVYRELWPGIDLVYRGEVGRLKYEFLAEPGADPGQVRLRYQGATSVRVLENGGLLVSTPIGTLEDAPPVAWQEVKGARVPVAVRFHLERARPDGEVELGFRVGTYDRTRPLVLDPVVLVYCGFIGGASDDTGAGVAVDAAGQVYVTGCVGASSWHFPSKTGPKLLRSGGQDAFVAKLSRSGQSLIYCGFIGGFVDDTGDSVAVDAAGNAYVAGFTLSDETSFPVVGGPDLTYNGSFTGGDGFVAKVSSSGTSLLYCGYIGGAGNDTVRGIAVNPAGEAFVCGITSSTQTTFPVAVGPDLTFNGRQDAFVAQVAASGASLLYCGFLGGLYEDSASGVAVDMSGRAYVCGSTRSTEATFPVHLGPDVTHNGQFDGFVARIAAGGASLDYCGFIGGSANDWLVDAAVDAAGTLHVAGSTTSTEATLPVTAGPDLTYNGGSLDTFVAGVSASSATLAYCGYIGGVGDDRGHAIGVDYRGEVYVTGSTSSTEATFPVKDGPDLTFNGFQDNVFVARLNGPRSALSWCGYIGGSSHDWATGIAVDAAGNAYVTGITQSNEYSFPVTVGPGLKSGGQCEVFVAKVAQLDGLQGTGTPRPGGTVHLTLTASGSAGLPYQMGSALSAGSIRIDSRDFGLSMDNLLVVSTHDQWPTIFSGYRGTLDASGRASAAIHIPGFPALIGARIHCAYVTLDPRAPSSIRSISEVFAFVIAR